MAGDGGINDCPAADPNFDFNPYLGECRICIDPNPDVAGMGIVIGVLLQATLMNLCVLLWWLAGPGFLSLGGDLRICYNSICHLICTPRRLCLRLQASFHEFGNAIRTRTGDPDGAAVGIDEVGELSPRRKLIRRVLRKFFKTWSDTQAVTGIALLFAAIMQANGGDLTLYHTAIVMDLLGLAADGQAIMLFYALRTDTIKPQQILRMPQDITRSPKRKALTATESHYRINYGLCSRFISSILFIVLYFIFSTKAYKRFRNPGPDDCFLDSQPATGNYGAWGIAAAVLVLVVYIAVFIPRYWTRNKLRRVGSLVCRTLVVLYPERPASNNPPRKRSRLTVLGNLVKLPFAYSIWIFTRFSWWCYDRELAFPIGSCIYIIWNAVDIVILKRNNEPLLRGGAEEEKKIELFGQIVAIVMVFAVALPLSDLVEAERTELPELDNQQETNKMTMKIEDAERVDPSDCAKTLPMQ